MSQVLLGSCDLTECGAVLRSLWAPGSLKSSNDLFWLFHEKTNHEKAVMTFFRRPLGSLCIAGPQPMSFALCLTLKRSWLNVELFYKQCRHLANCMFRLLCVYQLRRARRLAEVEACVAPVVCASATASARSKTRRCAGVTTSRTATSAYSIWTRVRRAPTQP